ncbi:DUF4010 domain-containing protein [Kaistia dalseonensis]|uniref:Uncharacterized membrane protein (DUF4010 family) n=1 Tax=Kaistia dalseonensis TaxID=410840 RepID=A0ABU0HCJ4_9HYPH|nr:DUF4010 domain-containing protein [Kaistia dalseonensis]MCX5497392.1 DUF4010 domain-containing protein [Kaistia dalseonensis]MDQ0440031.1 uncharacterized membrane protein (DUF4010 family) [Kaistia dalseonensis]
MDIELLFRLATALAIGLIVGLERGWQERDAPSGSRTAGIRTYGLSAFLGAAAALLARTVDSMALLATIFALYAVIFAAFKYREDMNDGTFSVTGVIAALLVFVLGAMAVLFDPRIAAAAGVATAGLLASRTVLHAMLTRITWPELRSALLLLGMSVIVLPILPNRAIDPLGAINPYEIWLFMVLTASVSFFGHVATRILGETKGLLVSVAAGAIVSSTAVTLVLARRAQQEAAVARLAGAALMAGMISAMRTLVILTIVKPALALAVLPAAGTLALALGLGAFLLIARTDAGSDQGTPPATRNPFDLGPLLLFAASFALVSAVTALLAGRFGTGGLYLTTATVSLADVDIAVLNMARLAGGSIAMAVATTGVLLALGVNALARTAYAGVFGPPAFSLRVASGTIGALALAGLVLWVTS